ncbi:MAG: hypothetical protein MHM6MM_005354 [Cercozoa sp. M6MM]
MAVVRMQRQLQLMQTALAVAEEAEKRRQQTTAQIDEAEVHVWLGTMLMKEFGDSNDNSNHTALTSTPAPAQQEAKEIDLDELFGTKDMLAESTTNTPSTIVYRYEDDEYNGADIDAASVSGGSEYEDLKEPVCNQGIPEELNLTPYHCTRRCTLGNFEKPVFPSLEGVHDLPEDYKTAADVSVACPFFTDSEDSVSAENSLTAEVSLVSLGLTAMKCPTLLVCASSHVLRRALKKLHQRSQDSQPARCQVAVSIRRSVCTTYHPALSLEVLRTLCRSIQTSLNSASSSTRDPGTDSSHVAPLHHNTGS